ncbi:putative RING-H2 finger protein ATL21B isoform X1 [Juglans microcarpa x Juglans regia]|uniref:putative RING-H2 finger protein ATL21B isoform X1 n=1 Tax=Juglans microcarpa x Juglans regia TaxID=2249226 RepID=UPI001B7DA4B0|nr:putative RING-H2 finger protein ATL21B isoform X1 [Juglans microcarpa x Juglans regia]
MASFQSFLFFIFIWVFLSRIESSTAICKTSSCDGSQSPPVRFPFRLKDSQPKSCGYPGFDLSCNNQSQTILTLPYSGDFVVEDIDYLGQSIYISDPNHCFPKRFLDNFNLSNSPFQFEVPENFTFFNCSSNATMMYLYWPIYCLSGDDYKVLFTTTLYTDILSPPTSCRMISTAVTALLPFPQSQPVQLIWGVPNCQRCAGSGGDCARENDSSLEVGCSNIPSNHNNGGLPRSVKYGVAIGVGIPGIVCMIGLACYLCGLVRVFSRRRHPSTELSISITPQRTMFATGLDGPTIESYPKTLLGESRRLPKPNDNTCPICLSEYQPKEELRTIPDCNHYFHANCVDEWLKMNATCPLCRNSPDGSVLVTPSASSSSSSSLSSISIV